MSEGNTSRWSGRAYAGRDPRLDEPAPIEPVENRGVPVFAFESNDEKATLSRRALPGAARSVLRRVSLGLYKGLESVSAWELRQDLLAAQSPLIHGGTGVIVVAQPKGGVGKTPLAVLVAAGLREFAGKEAVLWDVNDNGGARWSIPPGAATTNDLLIEPEGETLRSQVERAILPQDSLAYKVVAAGLPLKGNQFDTAFMKIRELATHVVIDTGNSPSSPHFVCALARAHIVLIPTNYAPASLEPTLRVLREAEKKWGRSYSSHVIGVQMGVRGPVDDRLRNFFAAHCAAVVNIPFDPHIAEGGYVRWSKVSEETRRATLRLTAQIINSYQYITGQEGRS